MDASIGEPFLLASYGVTQRLQKSAKAGKSNLGANVYASHDKFASGSDGYVTVTAQGDGVHVLDLSTLHPVISHTLGPSTGFSCPSLTLSVLEGEDNVYSTYAAISSSADVIQEDCGRTIWLWRENLSSTIGDRASQKKKASVMPHQISGIYACDGLPRRLLVFSPGGDVTVIDTDLKIQSTLASTDKNFTVSWTFVFPREACSFVPGSSTAIILFESSKDATRVRILGASGEDVTEIGSNEIPLGPDQITAVSCSSSGYLSVTTKDGSWHSYQIESQHNTINVYQAAEPLHLRSLAFIGKNTEVSLIGLNTSLVLLAAITSSPARSIVLLLWDLQYSVLLASHVLAIPSALSHLPQLSLTLRLVNATSPQALLILSPASADAQAKTTSRSSILVVPLTVPETSTIGNAMGRASAGAQWLVPSPAADTLGPERAKVLATVQVALSKNEPQTAETAFFEWEKREQQQSPSATEDSGGEHPIVLGHSFVRDLLLAVLQPSKQPSNTPYSAVLVQHLLGRRVVSASMVDGGLLAALKLRGDWNAIQLCLTNVVDLAESDLMFILQFVAAHSHKAGAEDAMQVDPPAQGGIPPLPTFLSACVQYKTSPAALRAAVHQYISQPEDLVVVLEALETWVGHWQGAEVIALPTKKNVAKDEHGVSVLKDGWQKDSREAHPPLVDVLSFLQTVLDASFLALLQHVPAHRVLRKVLARIEPEIRLTEQVETLRGPLELFARAQAKAVRDGKEGKEVVGDWRQRRRLAHERSGMAVGVYQLEELVL
ncbi:hypothetical protein C8J57DRAFT_1128769 [Mycena rebaudengoi]|nr:hypothetical protein C8J57DRAFT_1128769 [Mycena rebaudengoi]